MTGSLDSLCYTTLILQGSTCNATGQNLTLLIQEFLQEFGILIVNVLNTAFLETTVLFFFFTSTVGGVKYLISDCCAMI